ncbi:hypothetical protein HUX88_14300 [Duganella sp. BJB1802]|uniref:hypothetical protein n=1 Tax=unclassified Duganella TaxID=2636909 RepID=UPI0011C1CC6A|nr:MULTISPECIES: hypothetical protein [unclassified Duganella]NVD71713.1 hypothetical protein [Duganella sp. BJB1802]
MKKVNPTSLLQQRRRFLVRGAALTLATVACALPVSRKGKLPLAPAPAMPGGAPVDAVASTDPSALVRSGQPVPIELFFSSPENFSHFLALTGTA